MSYNITLVFFRLFWFFVTYSTPEIWLCLLFAHESHFNIVSQPAAGLSAGFQHIVLSWLKAADSETSEKTRGAALKCVSFPADLCHRWRDVHSGGDHRLLYIHCLRGLEEDPDRKDVMSTAPPSLPPSCFIYKCKVACLLTKSNSCPRRLPFRDHITSGASQALDLTSRLHCCFSVTEGSSQRALVTCGCWLSHVRFLRLQCREGRWKWKVCVRACMCVRVEPECLFEGRILWIIMTENEVWKGALALIHQHTFCTYSNISFQPVFMWPSTINQCQRKSLVI